MFARLLKLLCVTCFIGISAQAQCSGTGCLVISQVYGGGGNTGATYKNDFIEIFNGGTSAVSLSGLSVQYAASASASPTWMVTPLNTTLALGPGRYFLVQELAGTGGSVDLPTPDASGSLALSATTGKVALVSSTTAIAAGTLCPSDATILDFVPFGTAANQCSNPAPVLTNTTAALRKSGGCTSTGVSSSDFMTGAPNPRNTGSTANPCAAGGTLTLGPSTLPAGVVGSAYNQTITASGGNGSYTYSTTSGAVPGLTLSTAGLLSGVPTTATGSPFSLTVTASDTAGASGSIIYTVTVTSGGPTTCTPTGTIAQIQGNGNTSPFTGTAVTTSGVVTALRRNGYFIQMPAPGDGDPNTSDGVFVFTSSTPPSAAAIGNSVCVSGTVAEYTPDTGYSSITEIDSPTTSLLATAQALPTPVVLTSADFSPTGGLFQREKYEGMRVAVSSLTVVAPTQGTVNEASATATSNGLFYGVIPGTPRPFREPGVDAFDTLPSGAPSTVPRWDDNPEILQVNSLGQAGATALEVTTGATVSNLVGVIDYQYGIYSLLTDAAPATPYTVTGNVTYTAVPAPSASVMTVGSFNLQHFYDTVDDPGSDVALTATAYSNRLKKASAAIIKVTQLPDILGVEEMEKLTTLQDLAKQISQDAVAAGLPDPMYQSYLVPGNDISDINVGILAKSPKVTVLNVVQMGKDTTYTDPTSGTQALLNDRPSLVMHATVKRSDSDQALPVTFIVNHLRSLLSINDNTVSGTSTNGARVRAKREAQAEFLANVIQGYQAQGENIISVGDYNAYQVSDGYVDVLGIVRGNPVPASQVVVPPASGLVNPILTDLVDYVPMLQQYSDTFDGTAQVLDHILVSSKLLPRLSQVAYGRVNADFPESYRGDATRPERVSDHDPVVAYFTLPLNHLPTATAQTSVVSFNTPSSFALQVSDPDAGDSLTASTTTAPAHGTVTYSGTTANYTPAAGRPAQILSPIK